MQYTPNQSDWGPITSKVMRRNPKGHAPKDAIWHGRPYQWSNYTWDGKPYNPTRMKRQDFYKALCPSDTQEVVRGIREVYEKTRPFWNESNPQRREVDNWHTIFLNHIRALVGYTESNRQARPNQCISARALWAEERYFTSKWDRKYPGDSHGSPPCLPRKQVNPHCGATFIPSNDDQKAYGVSGCTKWTPSGGSTEGTFYTRSSEGWAIKLGRSFCQTLRSEGFWGGHTGPWFHREIFGFSFHDDDEKNAPLETSGGTMRAKWGGTLMSSKWAGGTYTDGSKR